jgi:predicted RNA binding protein YcfA (HicA-like mRNA interferase family)
VRPLILHGCLCAQQDCASIDLDAGDGAWLSKQTCSGAHATRLVLAWQAWPRVGTPAWRLKKWQRRAVVIPHPNEIARTRFLGKLLAPMSRSRSVATETLWCGVWPPRRWGGLLASTGHLNASKSIHVEVRSSRLVRILARPGFAAVRQEGGLDTITNIELLHDRGHGILYGRFRQM